MTINMGWFDEQKKRIESVGIEGLVSAKKEITEMLQREGLVSKSPEDPRCKWLLFLDILCDVRLGACYWRGGEMPLVVAGDKLDLLADWYELLLNTARSVNRRQKDGRGGCNQQTFAALADFHKCRILDIDRLVSSGNRYAAYLEERTQQIFRMNSSDNWAVVGKVDALRSMYLG